MVMSNDKLGMEITEPERVMEDFRQKLIYSLQREKEKLREAVNRDAKLILTKAYQESASLTSKAQDEAKEIINQAEEEAKLVAENILAEAQKQADQIIENAEQTVRREAKEKTRKEMDNILRSAREEAARQSNKAIQTAEKKLTVLFLCQKEAEGIIQSANDMKEKAAAELLSVEKKTAEAVEKAFVDARKEATEKAQKEAAEIITQAKIRAQKEREYLLATTMTEAKQAAEAETARILQKAQQEASEIVMAAKEKVRIQIEESTRLMMDIQQRMHNVIGTGLDFKPGNNNGGNNQAETDNKPVIVNPITREEKNLPQARPAYEPVKPAPASDNPQPRTGSLVFDEENQTYEGRLKIDIAPPTDSDQISSLEKNLLKTYLTCILSHVVELRMVVPG